MPYPSYAALSRLIFFDGHKYDMKTFHEFIELKIKEGLWLNDKKALLGGCKLAKPPRLRASVMVNKPSQSKPVPKNTHLP